MNSIKTGKRILQPYDFCILLFALWNMFLFFGRGLIDGEYDWTALTALSISVFYFALREQKTIEEKQVDILRILCSVLCEMVLWHYTVNPKADFGFLTENTGALASFSLFSLCLAAAGYCRKQKREKRYLYMVMAVISSLCLFLSCEITAIYLGVMIFLLISLLMKPAFERVKRVIELICMYLGLLSFIPLADSLLGMFKTELIYNLESSVYLDMVFSVIAVGFMDWWDKRKEEPGRLVKEFRKLCGYLAAGILTGAFFGDGLRKTGTMAQCMQKYKEAGCVLLVIFTVAAGKRLYEKYLRRGNARPVFGLVSVVYLIQSAFFPQQAVITSGYIIFLSAALQYKKREKRESENEKKKETEKSGMDRLGDDITADVLTGEYSACGGNGAG